MLFETPEDSQSAMIEKQGQKIGHRWIELYQMSYNDYKNFDSVQADQRIVRLQSYITPTNAHRCVKLRGLPYNCSVENILAFFDGFSVSESDVVLELVKGKQTGYALVFLKDKD